ncbi:MAG: hypothetical protein US62_C0044G0002 [Candidatus Woesebacteria bacterium GW2011_GWA1_37_8]|uniref:Uncharacterized protein n=2 Tax=Candidatus Woeseibacteriota TaxID=1752722 RepID=A0A0G0PCL2_9BACT|nr:MAG: hypothetical protein US39_C0016G0024 [Microgenomates group bacterium GW2011_GWC1_37_12b]KKQ43674.1 MAG: hypothetical protein US62_C0044G0002 [Candidatus Woesebacteria bacterium GW2011_GWA1_37_8]KKQ87021.1 MAG: hypothetical protein UT10_C0012G0009 [Candidatus Woesebacteria bacterium GW2011_GWB1_38_8b]
MEPKLFDFKKLGILVLGFFLVAFSFFVLAGKGFASIKKLYDDLKNENQEIRILKENVETLKKIDLAIINKSDDVFIELPNSSFVPFVISNVKTESLDKILIDNLRSEPLNMGETIHGISLAYEGHVDKLDNIITFAESVQKYSPITAFPSIEMNEIDGKYNVNFKVATFWSDLPTELPHIDVTVNGLTDEETKLLNEISNYKKPAKSDLNPQNPVDRPNPFI